MTKNPFSPAWAGRLVALSHRSFVFAVALAVTAAGNAAALEVEGVKVPDTYSPSGAATQLVLNGAGVRTRFFFKVYVGALYLEKKMDDGEAIINSTGQKHVVMFMLRGLGSDQLYRALRDGIEANHAEVQVQSLEPSIKRLESMFDRGKALVKGDVVRMEMLQGTGTRVFVNGESRGTVPGDEIGRALLRVWLGDHPADEDLKKAMLGG